MGEVISSSQSFTQTGQELAKVPAFFVSVVFLLYL